MVAGCGSGTSPSPRDELAAYVARVEPIRLQVNRLLDRADPTLSALSDRQLPAAAAQRRLGRLERRFAVDAVKIAAVGHVPEPLRNAQRAYAHTYVLEDSYLNALVAAIPHRSFDELPHTQSRQRAAITRLAHPARSPSAPARPEAAGGPPSRRPRRDRPYAGGRLMLPKWEGIEVCCYRGDRINLAPEKA